MQYLEFDVMIGDRYLCTMKYRHNPAFVLTEEELIDFITTQRPSLKNKDFHIAL